MKKALCIQSTPADSHFNRDSGYELPDCWFALNRKLRGGAIIGHHALLAGHMQWRVYDWATGARPPPSALINYSDVAIYLIFR